MPQDPEIERILQDPKLNDNPLMPVVKRLYDETQEHKRQLQKLMRISDAFDGLTFQENSELREQFGKQLRRLQKIARISDMYQKNMVDMNEQLEYHAQHDLLTDLPNRRFAINRLKELEAIYQRKQTPFCLALIDIDHFKAINDKFGHELGDMVLKVVAKVLKKGARKTDVCSRWGGEEFLLIVPDLALESAEQMVERILHEVRAIPWQTHLPGNNLDFTVINEITFSAGMTVFQTNESFDETIKRADDALYQAKQAGRNCIRIA
ncbi:diguanylate cyclase (GGDEF) domain-containing protein [Methylophaga frappieri]|uniref:diguanylate cyclase n=2 Tax=Methylophaga frappieri (strain ATCC BAA-2434 / DSM 25690 / JAM7) TaxID=754477 RepID=I1YF10_METFJ|nr:diguanylate cyclase (GGDEF) domain-containing protein [Methylophaga frappieri]